MAPADKPKRALPPFVSSFQRPVSERPVHRAPSGGSHRLLRLELPADLISASVARNRVWHWLTALRWPGGQRDDIVLAVNEAVSNAIEHAYLDQPCGLVEIRGGVETTPGGQRRVTIIVRDHGRWRPIPIHHENRRRGIPLMRACMDTVTIGRPADDKVGTRVVLRSRAVPPPFQAAAAPDSDDT
jgi:serine/threonine-protein kinase RsbW